MRALLARAASGTSASPCVAVGTVKSRTSRARARLVQLLELEDGEAAAKLAVMSRSGTQAA